MLTENTRTDCPELFTPPVWKTSCGVGKILENSKGTPHSTTTKYCCTDDLIVMDSSQRVWTSTFYIVNLLCFRRAGGQYPTSLLMLVVLTVVLLLFKKKLKAPGPSEHPPVQNVNLSHITACKESGPWSHRKIILARREVGNKCRLYKHVVVAAKK